MQEKFILQTCLLCNESRCINAVRAVLGSSNSIFCVKDWNIIIDPIIKEIYKYVIIFYLINLNFMRGKQLQINIALGKGIKLIRSIISYKCCALFRSTIAQF
jgi:hypothetical protein